MNSRNQIFVHSCESTEEIAADRIALTVASPPYRNTTDNEIHASDDSRFYRTCACGKDYSEYSHYLDWLEKIFGEVLRVTKPGGFCAMILGTVLFEEKHYPVPHDAVARLTRSGWEFHQDILWRKCAAGIKRARVAIQHPYPGYYYPNIMTEYILVFRKPGPAIYEDADEEKKARGAYPIHRLITLHSYPGDTVLDPFAGSGQTLKAARNLGRNYVGYETIRKYADLAAARAQEPLDLREYQLISIFDKLPIDTPLEGPPPECAAGAGKTRKKRKKPQGESTPGLF